jgi:long-subunit fatty acid transport protein
VFDELPVNFQGPASGSSRSLIEAYNDSKSYRFGLEQKFARYWNASVRAGFSLTQTPAPDETVTPLLPDMDRRNFAAGLGLPFGGRYALDLGYLHVDTQGRRGRTGERTSYSQTTAQLNNGFYRLNADIFSLSLKASL